MRNPRTCKSQTSISRCILGSTSSTGSGARRSWSHRGPESNTSPRPFRTTSRCLLTRDRSTRSPRRTTSTRSRKRNGRSSRARSSKSICPIVSRFRSEGRPPPRTSASGRARHRRSEDSSKREITASCPRVPSGSSAFGTGMSKPVRSRGPGPGVERKRRTSDSLPNVHHLESVVRGRLRDDVTIPRLLRATFPGGSITGAPKPRAMEIIERLEPHRRGVYTGAIGYISWDRSIDWSIAIRTATVIGDTAHFAVGGGIVADSDPHAEYRETLDKLRGHAEALTQDRVEVTPDGLRVA